MKIKTTRIGVRIHQPDYDKFSLLNIRTVLVCVYKHDSWSFGLVGLRSLYVNNSPSVNQPLQQPHHPPPLPL